MEFKILLYALGIWAIFLVLAIVNGIVRESIYAPRLGEDLGHAVSSIIAIIYILAITYWFTDSIKADVIGTDLLWIGALWLILTVIFEFGFGHYVMGRSWDYLLADYNILKGRLWSLVLLTMLIAPPLWGLILSRLSS